MVLMPLSLSASMMRWKPSVSSRSVSAAGFSCVAACAMTVPPRISFVTFTSIEIVGVPSDMVGKSDRVLANQVLGARGVARLERLDDVHVVADRAGHAIV